MKTKGTIEKVRKGEETQERRGEGAKEKESETARTDKRRSGENGEGHAGSPHFQDFAFTMLISQQMRLGREAHRRLASPS